MPGRIGLRNCLRYLVLLGLAAFVAAGVAHAQLVQQYFPSDIPGYAPDFSASVVNRMMMQNQSLGTELGDFVIRPQVSESFGYNSNTLGTPGSGSSEAETSAGLRVNSDWARDAIGASFSVDDRRYLQLPSASFTNWTAGAGGALTLGNDTATIAYSHLALNLSATDLGVSGVVTPVPYSVDDVRTSYVKLFSRFSVTPSFEFQNFTFGQSGGATVINYDSLSHQTESGSVTSRYELTPGDAAVAIIRTSQAQYGTDPSDNYVDLGGFLGLDFRTGSVVQYRALVGFESRSFPNSSAATVSTPTFEIDAIWTPTKLDTVTVSATRSLDDPTSPFARNQIVTDGRIELDHELRTNVFLTGSAEGGQSQSESSVPGGGSTTQTQVHLGASALWNINRNLRATLGYGFTNSVGSGTTTSTTVPGTGFPTFTGNTVMLGLTIYQ
jgi:hypothetical protein